jgi:hypothetical protein
MCRNCGHVYEFDPVQVDGKKTGADFHLKAAKSRARKKKAK